MNSASDRSKRMKAMFGGINADELAAAVAPSPLSQAGRRVSSGAVRSMQDSFSAIEDENARLREQIAGSEAVVELGPDQVVASFVRDRMDGQVDPDLAELVRSIGERLVHMALNVRVQGDHLADGHAFLLKRANLWIGLRVPLVAALAEQ